MDLHDDDIIISGIAGRYPDCDSFDEFKEALLNGVDMVTEDARRWEPGTQNTPLRAGKLNDIEHFDCGYFGISPRQADVMDPRHRIMFETVFEAIVDSGYNPKELRGSNTGVYVGISSFDSSYGYKELENTCGYSIIGCSLSQIANRTSYCFDFKGPSFVLDTACSTGLYALANAVKAMETGDIDSAIVSAVNINLHPHEAREFNLLNMLSPNGKCSVFSTDRGGYARSEAIITIFLQRKSKCRRMYSKIMGTAINCDGWKVEGITFPSSAAQLELIRLVYEKNKLNPDDVTYIEMHGTGTPAGDDSECDSVAEFFCRNRKEPLPVGAVKSNMGHPEVSAGLCSLSKVLVAMETGIIPANLHCDNIDYTLPGLNNGKLKVVTENLPWHGGMVSINCFGFGGANAHVVLKSNEHCKQSPRRVSHRLVHVSGRTEDCVKYYLEGVQQHQDDQEFLALVDEIHKIDVDGHPYRGYAVLGDNPVSEINRINRDKRSVWFIYTGMGSQWIGIGKDLMKIDIFKNTIRRCAVALKPYDIDLEHILTSEDPSILDDITHCFLVITATEIALTDVIKAFGIEADGFAGHSLGEIGCAYYNGELSPEKAILTSFIRGYAVKHSKCPAGQMASIGLSKQEISKLLPEGVYLACVNGSNNVTISGPPQPVQQFVMSMNQRGIFAKLVETGGYAFHTRYIDTAATCLRNFLTEVLTDPKPRSEKWISSSREKSEWNDPSAQLCSADYHYNNFLRPVLFDQVLSHIPQDAIVVEISPHGLLSSLIKREKGPDVTCLSLASKHSKDNVQFLLSNIGLLFVNGVQPNLRNFYNDVSFPVGRGTQNIGSLIKWDHSIKWFTPFFEPNQNFGKKVTLNTNSENYSYLKGHNIDGRVLMAATGYLELVWKVVADTNTKSIEKLPVIFESVKFLRATVLPEGEDVVFYVNIMRQSGYFEIFEGGSVCCSGTIKLPKSVTDAFLNPEIPKPVKNGYKPLFKPDIYKWLHLKRYMYSGIFQGIEMVDVDGTVGKLRWNDSFATFLDTMLQITLVPEYLPELLLPTRLQKLVIDPIRHLEEVSLKNNELEVYHDKELKLIKSGGIELTNMEALVAPKRQYIQADPIMESHVFVPYITDHSPEAEDIESSLKIALQIVIENNGAVNDLLAHELVTDKKNSLAKLVEEISKGEPIVKITFVDVKSQKVDIILCSDGYFEDTILHRLNDDGFIIFYGLEKDCIHLGLPVVFQNSFKGKGIYLLRKISTTKRYTILDVNTYDFGWMNKLKAAITNQQIVYVINKNDDYSGIMGLVKCLNFEPSEKLSIKCILIKNNQSDRLALDADLYTTQLSKQLTVNVLRKGVWGSYRHIPIDTLKNIDAPNACNYIQTIGDLSSFRWVERPVSFHTCSIDAQYAYVYYAALNFRDVMVATGKMHSITSDDPCKPEVEAGFEFSGLTRSGKRVMGITVFALSLQVFVDPLFTWEVPNSWSLEEAATVPVVYATCYYGIIMRGQLQMGESILIHAGAGGIGIAAISIALSMNCEIFTTVGSEEKRDFLIKLFPKLKPENIGNSRNTSFEQVVMRNTKGTGVDMVLNSLSADLFQASIRCVAQRGRFIEIGKMDLGAGTPISSSLFSKNTSFYGVFLDDLMAMKHRHPIKLEINRLLADGVAKGVVRPLPRTVFLEDQVEDAYRFLSTGKHKGKVLIQIRNESATDSPQRTIEALPRIYFDPKKTYILVGGLGGLGLELTNFLIKRCAKKIVLNSRRGVTNGYQSLCMKRWSQLAGVTVEINTDDSSTLEGAQSLVKFAEQLGPVGGVFNMALVLEDALFINQTPEKFESVFKSKIYSGLNLDRVTRSLCTKLDHFVVLSSLTAGRGNPGQTNYGMANSALERLCEKRREDSLPGLAVQYGPVGEVGAVAEILKLEKHGNMLGLGLQTINSCLNALETFMLQSYTIGSTFVFNEESPSSGCSSKSPVETVAHILGIKDIGLIDKNLSLGELGLDSLMTAEIKQTFYRNFNIEISVEDIRDLTFTKIMQMYQNSESIPEDVLTSNGVKSDDFALNSMLSEEMVVEVINDKSYSRKVFFIPPLEGHVQIMLPLAKRLKANVYGLQFIKELDSKAIEDYARYFIKIIKNIQREGPYLVCGYSYGGALSFEIGVQLDKQNDHVNLFLIDGTPNFVKRILEKKFYQQGKLNVNAKRETLKAFLHGFDKFDNEQIETIIDDSTDVEEQMIKAGEFVSKHTNYDCKIVSTSADRYIKRIAAGYYYQPHDTFRGQATLVRSDSLFKELSTDYDLQTICEQPIRLEIIKGNHTELLLGDRLSRIADLINNIL